MRSLMKFAGLAAGMILLMATMRELMAFSTDRVWVIDSVVLLLPLGHGFVGASGALLAWRTLSRVGSVPPGGDRAATAVLVATQIRQQTELRLAIGLGVGLAVLGAATMILPGLGWAAAQVIVGFIELTLIVVLATQRPLLWSALTILAAATVLWGLFIWAMGQMISMD